MIDIRSEIEKKTIQIDRMIESLLPVQEGYAGTVIEAMNYSIGVGGKRLRPMLMSESYFLFGSRSQRAVDRELLRLFMAAIECIHTYSLVHDDLPAMDDDLLRRGQPTTHAKYGEAMAILAGDALLNYGMELTSRALAGATGDDVRAAIRAQRLLFDRSGIYGMIGGQTADVEAEKSGHAAGSDTDATGSHDSGELLDYIHRNKTAALIVAAMTGGAILGGADDEEQRVMTEIAMKIGIAFQIEDDILDIEGDEALLGKPIGSDEKNEKLTYVSVYGMEKAKADVERLTAEAHELLSELPGDHEFFDALFDELTHRES